MSSKSTKKQEIIKVSTRYILIKAHDMQDVAIGIKYNHITELINIYPEKGNAFFFKNSDPELVQVIGELLIEAAKLAQELQDA